VPTTPAMPSKALLRPAELLAEVERVPGAREALTGALDVQKALSRRDQVIHDLDDRASCPGSRPAASPWSAVRPGSTASAVSWSRATADRAPCRGLSRVRQRRRHASAERPERTPHRGRTAKGPPPSRSPNSSRSWAVGCRLRAGNRPWSSLGSAVVLVEALPRLLAAEEPVSGERLADSLRARGVDVRLGAKAVAAGRDGDGRFTLTLEDGARLESDELLVAVGRRPHTGDLGLETVDLEPGKMIHGR